MTSELLEKSKSISNLKFEDVKVLLQKGSPYYQFKFLDLDKTNCVLFVLIHLVIFVLPMFAIVLLLVDTIHPLFELFENDKAAVIKLVIAKVLVLLVIGGISFLEMFAILSNIFITFVLTEALLWTGYLFGLSYNARDEKLVASVVPRYEIGFPLPILIISICIVVKICVGVFLKSKLTAWMKSKSFPRHLGKSV